MVAEAVPHHITQRGNNRQDTFYLPDDRRFYLETLLPTKCRDHGVAFLGYCLETNHVHLVAVPRSADALAQALGQAHGKYARWFNRRYRRSGHLCKTAFIPAR